MTLPRFSQGSKNALAVLLYWDEVAAYVTENCTEPKCFDLLSLMESSETRIKAELAALCSSWFLFSNKVWNKLRASELVPTLAVVKDWIRSAKAIANSESVIDAFRDPVKNFVCNDIGESVDVLTDYLEGLQQIGYFDPMAKKMLLAGAAYVSKLEEKWSTRGPALLEGELVTGLTMNNQTRFLSAKYYKVLFPLQSFESPLRFLSPITRAWIV